MRLLLSVVAVVVPIPHNALLAIDRSAGYRNYLPTRVAGFTYTGWSHKGGVLRVEFRSKSGLTFEWRVLPMTGDCAAGKQQSFQVGGNKVWWGRNATEQRAWRCVFDLAGRPIRLEAASSAPTKTFAPVGLAVIAAHAKRY